MSQYLDLALLQIIATTTLLIALVTSRQAYRAWAWPWRPQIPDGFNGRWKLDWGVAGFLWVIGIDYQVQVVLRARDNAVTTGGLVLHGGLALIALLVTGLIRREHHKQRRHYESQ